MGATARARLSCAAIGFSHPFVLGFMAIAGPIPGDERHLPEEQVSGRWTPPGCV